MSDRILLVDDEVGSLKLYQAMLEKALPDAHFQTANNGGDALEAVRSGSFDLILLDAMMPGITGFEVCQRLKEDPKTRLIPILMISGVMVNKQHRLDGLMSGAEGYVCKPFEWQELVAQVKVLLRIKRYEDQLRHQEERLEKDLADRTTSLRTSEEQLRTLFEHSPDAIFVEDFEGRVLDVNASACRLHGCERQDLIGHHVLELVPDEYRQSVAEQFPRWHSQKLMAFEGYSRTRAGVSIPVEIRSTVIQYRGGAALLFHVRDITERRKVEAELVQHRKHLAEMVDERTRELACANEAFAESRRNFHSIVEKSGEGILVLARDGTVRYANPAAGDLLSKSVAGLVGQPFGYSLVDQGLVELSVKKPDGEVAALEAAVDATDWQGQPALLLFLRDITERKRLEQHLRRTENLESVGLLAGGIAHDFNNLLVGILGNISYARTEVCTRDVLLEVLGEAEHAALRAKSLTQQLLTFAKGGAPVRKAGRIRELMEEASRFVLAGSKSAYRLQAEPGLWNAYMDGGQISQVLENIVLNAHQAMPNGGIIHLVATNFVCAASDEAEMGELRPGRYVKVSIRDTGVGMSPATMARIFDPYFTTKSSGTGLGLSVAYSIISKHEGTITVTSHPGEGTTFCVYVPATDEVPEAAVTPGPTAPCGGGRVLVMDDEDFIRALAARMLVALGYEADCVADGAGAIECYRVAMAEGRPYAAVLLDLTIPGGMGGEEVMQHLRRLDPEVRAIVSSGYALEPVFSDFARHGFKGGIAKPYDMQALAAAFAEVLNA